LHAVDARDWARIRACCADHVAVDYRSLFGGAAETITSDVLMERWRGLLPGFDGTQHVTGPVLVSNLTTEAAEVRTAVRGYHYAADASGGAVWMVAAHYQMRLSKVDGRWVIATLTLEVTYQEGNVGLPALASERAARRNP
jgi:SnoaL-like domain